MEKTPMQQLIDKIELYDQRGGINMPTLKAVLQSYLRLETEYLEKLKENLVESNEDMLKVYIEHAKHGEICLKSSSSSAPKSSYKKNLINS